MDPKSDADPGRWFECEFIARLRMDGKLNEEKDKQLEEWSQAGLEAVAWNREEWRPVELALVN